MNDDRMTQEALAEIEGLAEKATAGPWYDVDKITSYDDVEFTCASRLAVPQMAAEIRRAWEELGRYARAKSDGRLVELPDFPQDMDDILEPLKVQSALNSEIMKLNHRRENRPKDVSILDYTIIAALYRILESDSIGLRAENGGSHE